MNTIKCCQPNAYKYAECNCQDCIDQDRYEHVLSAALEEEREERSNNDE